MTAVAALPNLLAWLAQSTVVIAIALLALRVVPIDAAAVRYAALRTLLLFCLLLPVLQSRTPTPSVSLELENLAHVEFARGADTATNTNAVQDSRSADRSGFSLLDVVVVALAVGFAARLIWLGAGLLRLRALRDAGEIARADADHAELQSIIGTRAVIRYVPSIGQPVTFGFRRAVVLLPEHLRGRPLAIQRAVAAHELWHVRRRDWLWTVAEEVVRAALWFHPSVWMLISRIQEAREEVVDELSVLTTGSRRHYLEALLSFADARPALAAAAFARRRHLVHRVQLISKESVMSSRRIVASFIALAVAAGVAGSGSVSAFPMSAPAQTRDRMPPPPPPPPPAASTFQEMEARMLQKIGEEPGAAAYTALATLYWQRAIHDPGVATSGNRDTYVRQGLAAADSALGYDPGYVEALIYKNLLLRLQAQSALDAGERERLVSEADQLRTRALALRQEQSGADRRALDSKLHSAAVALPPPPPPPSRQTDRPAPPPPPPPPPPLGFERVDGLVPVRAGGDVTPPAKIRDVRPVYPPIAIAAGVEGVVILDALIDTAGRVREARVLRSIPLLDQAAVDAVRQWQFAPPVVAGQPAPVIMTVTISFRLP